jgi:hypothetical protein
MGLMPANRSLRAFSAVGVLAAALIAVTTNVLVARFYKRWDVTSAGLYTLSQATKDTLAGLSEPVDVIVFLSASDTMSVSVRHMLTAYGAETTQLRPRFVDPDRNPAEFLALQQKYGLVAGKTEDGRVVTDASIVLVRGERHWFVTSEDLVAVDDNDGRARPKLEQALTEGIRNVLERERAKICFSDGHNEMSIDDGGPNGLAELRYRLEKNNYQVEAPDLTTPAGSSALESCRVLVIAGPEVPFDAASSERVAAYLRGGGNALVLSNPVLDEDNRIQSTGLGPITRLGGIEFADDFVIEKEESLRAPSGLGETYFATPKEHDITKGLVRGDKPLFKVLLSASQSLRARPEASPISLLATSDKSFSLHDIRPFVQEGQPVERSPSDAKGPFSVAFAAELAKPASSPAKNGPRLVVVGSANVAWGRNWRDPTLLGNRLFCESALSWLAARPAIVSVPEKPAHDVGLSLTEESLSEVWRYVLLYMPATAAALGALILYRRRSTERRSRRREEARDKDRERKAETAEEKEPEATEDTKPAGGGEQS